MSPRRPVDDPPRWVSALLVLLALVLGYAYGWVASAIPSPSDPDVFWVANLAAPFVVLPFVVAAWVGCRRASGLPGAVSLGALTGAGMVAGFYGLHRVGRDPSADPGQVETLAGAYARWLSTFVLGRPGGIPWLTIGVVCGCAAGVLAWLWTRRGARWAGLLAVSPLLLEPLARMALGARGIPLAGGYPRLPGNLTIWALEAVVGTLAVWLVVRVPTADRQVGRQRIRG
ncbi:hypothetical protein [Humibacillus xanthopallidus]|uniref:Uncharacterized protein n=1 Tax=Humibacillus xanthopallidus TaxID=412689 RepID=A0A543HA80_9MICO|nr:hypothetical protein [Humibacillus xanthopallidus]TQM55238.1 hypothetical protein FBY41_4566 [Humibacillus xanthopallidus]